MTSATRLRAASRQGALGTGAQVAAFHADTSAGAPLHDAGADAVGEGGCPQPRPEPWSRCRPRCRRRRQGSSGRRSPPPVSGCARLTATSRASGDAGDGRSTPAEREGVAPPWWRPARVPAARPRPRSASYRRPWPGSAARVGRSVVAEGGWNRAEVVQGSTMDDRGSPTARSIPWLRYSSYRFGDAPHDCHRTDTPMGALPHACRRARRRLLAGASAVLICLATSVAPRAPRPAKVPTPADQQQLLAVERPRRAR